MIRALIFDCFGVLTSGSWDAFCRRHFQDEDTTSWMLARDLNRASDGGYITQQEYHGELAMLTGVEPAKVAEELQGGIVINVELLRVIASYRQEYKIGMLSNVGNNWMERNFSDEQRALFDACVLSGDTGFVKPDQRAYEFVAAKLGVTPEECAFVDDLKRNVQGAEQTGMTAHLYVDNTDTSGWLARVTKQL
jgi:putative hydrolase of the HAD superfamily